MLRAGAHRISAAEGDMLVLLSGVGACYIPVAGSSGQSYFLVLESRLSVGSPDCECQATVSFFQCKMVWDSAVQKELFCLKKELKKRDEEVKSLKKALSDKLY